MTVNHTHPSVCLTDHEVFLTPEGELLRDAPLPPGEARTHTMSWQILRAHHCGESMEKLRLKVDALASPDNNYVSILQTAQASGLTRFPLPYVLTNCHNSLCAVGGTANEDDHIFGLDAVRRYGGIFVPPYRAVLHQYMREMMAFPGAVILGSDSHTRYGALGTMGFGEGGGEIVKQLLGKTYDLDCPEVAAVVLTGAPRPGVGPHDVALALIAAAFSTGFLKNRVLEFLGPGIASLSMDFRMGIDVMTTESAALSSVWPTDGAVRAFLREHGREDAFRPLAPAGAACYDALVQIDLSAVEPMMALPFHPSNAVSIRAFQANPGPYLAAVEEEGSRILGREEGFPVMEKLRPDGLYVDQGLITGCSGGLFENIAAVSDILDGAVLSAGGPDLGIHPASQPVGMDLMRQGIADRLAMAGAPLRPAMCGGCFGVCDIPGNGQLSVRHVTRNFPSREGSKTAQSQMAGTILMDARSVAATVRAGGRLTSAAELPVSFTGYTYSFDPEIYRRQVVSARGAGDETAPLRMGPGIAPWPEIPPLSRHLLLRAAGVYEGSLTTDELIPSGEATSYRSNPEKLSEFTMSGRDRGYLARARAIRAESRAHRSGEEPGDEVRALLARLCEALGCAPEEISIGSLLVSRQIGDGSSREQAVSCQRVLGGCANLAEEYSTKRYRSNCINWGVLPLRTKTLPPLENGDWVLVPSVLEEIQNAGRSFEAVLLKNGSRWTVTLGDMTREEREILAAGCLINYNQKT